jgi:hypothetical protein
MTSITFEGSTEIGTERTIRIGEISLFAVVVALILAGIGAWAVSTTQAHVDILLEAGIDPLQMMVSGPDLPTVHYVDYSFVFE